MLLKLNFISKQTQSLSPSHCGWRQVKSSIPSKKKDWRENGHTRYLKNRCQEWSFYSFGFAIIIVLAEVGSIWACLEKVLSHLSASGLGFGGWAIWRGLELSTEGLISALAANTSLLCHLCFMSWMCVLLKSYGRNWTLSWFLFSNEAIKGTEVEVYITKLLRP